MDDQVTLRLPAELARTLESRARAMGVAKSVVVREALQAYFAAEAPADPESAWRQLAPLVGSVRLDRSAAERDALARRIRANNWRK